jgi:hypothetical protein
MRRTLRFDGIHPQTDDPGKIQEVAAFVARERDPVLPNRPFDILVEGITSPNAEVATAVVGPLAQAGATWWIETDWNGATVDSLRRRIHAGPPRLPSDR